MNAEFDSKEFSRQYNYYGKLGAIILNNETFFSVWAPKAQAVVLNIYYDSIGATIKDFSLEMKKMKRGIFKTKINSNLHGVYYTYTIRHSDSEVETVDPYANSTNLNGMRGMVVDYLNEDVMPNNWQNDKPIKLKSYSDAIIYEVHVRDFTSKLEITESKKFDGMSLSGIKTKQGNKAGFDHVKDLGVTHIHLLPIAEYASIDQSRLNDGNYNAYNWGYDPLHYNVPCGVYASNPNDGKSKVFELRKLIYNYHKAGIGVILDVVYNHTYNFINPLYNVLPGYFYRSDSYGNFTNGSGCGNEIASERPMCRKFILDSLKNWMENYHVDGFRFDLMGLLDLDTMKEVEKLHKINPSLILYGEGWIGGSSSLDGTKQTNKWNVLNIKKRKGSAGAIAVFSDITRDKIKGPVFLRDEGGYINGRSYENMLGVKYASMGCTSPNFNMNWVNTNSNNCITYTSSHDNYSLMDKLSFTAELKEQAKRSRLAGAIILTSRGIPFFMAGEEFLRTKKNGDKPVENSYNAIDNVNGIDWSLLDEQESNITNESYKKLIKIRKSHKLLRLTTAKEIEKATNFIIIESRYDIIAYTLKNKKEELLIIYNPLNEYLFDLPKGKWKSIFGVKGSYESKILIPPISCIILKRVFR